MIQRNIVQNEEKINISMFKYRSVGTNRTISLLFQMGLGGLCILIALILLLPSISIAKDKLKANPTPTLPTEEGEKHGLLSPSPVGRVGVGLVSLVGVGFVKSDTSNIDVRSDTAYFKILADDRAFVYKEPPPNPSILTIIMNKIGEFLDKMLNGKDWNIYQIIMLLLFVGLIIYVILRLMKAKGSSLLFVTPNSNGSVFLDENNQDINYIKLIDDAVQSQRYSDAVRYYYLNILRELSSKNIIKWAISKTNFDYFDEIKDNELRYSFRKISYIFDYIEYGEFSIDLQGFNKVKKSFEDFNNMIGHRQ